MTSTTTAAAAAKDGGVSGGSGSGGGGGKLNRSFDASLDDGIRLRVSALPKDVPSPAQVKVDVVSDVIVPAE